MKKNILRIYIKTLFSVMRWKVALSIFLMLCVGLTEGFGLLMLIPLLQLTGLETTEDNIGELSRFISSLFNLAGIQITLITVLGAYIFIMCLNALLNYFQTVSNHALEYKFVHCLREKLYTTITNTKWLYFAQCRVSTFIHALTTELGRVSQGTYFLLQLIVTSIVAIVYLFLALKLSIQMTIVTFISGILLLFLFKNKALEAQTTGEKLSEETSSIYSAIIEHLEGMKTVKSYGAEIKNRNMFSEISQRVTQMFINTVSKQANVKLYIDIASVLILSFILYISLDFLKIKTATVLLLLYLFARVMPRFQNILQSYHQIANMLPAFNGILEMQALCEKNKEDQINQKEIIKIKDSIKFKDVSFGYNTENLLFKNLNLTLECGKTTAIIGSSGSGKSTIADLIMGLLVSNKGQILIDDKVLSSEYMKSWREQIGYVSQDTFLFHDTIKANLLWACPTASNEEINKSLEVSACKNFISQLPNGLETIVGDRGVLLSGGERQRIALARALLRKPSLLILDEATNSLDLENEKYIQDSIEKLHGEITILVISHTLSAIRNADTIYTIENGNIKELKNADLVLK